MAVPLIGKVLLDTNVFIDYLRAGRHSEWVAGRVQGRVRLLSSIVLLELRLGADTVRRRRAIDRLRGAFPATRMVVPRADDYGRAGDLFLKIHRDGRVADRLAAVNDILIALSARQAGATVVTSNAGDFREIARRLPGLRWTLP